jgi:hypothetical protein
VEDVLAKMQGENGILVFEVVEANLAVELVHLFFFLLIS